MPLTQAQINIVNLLLNGDPEDESVVFIEQLITDMVLLRDDIRSILNIHGYYPAANNLTALQGIKAALTAKANQLATLLS